MNRRQKKTITDFVLVMAFTLLFIAAMFNVKEFIKKSEALRSMKILSKILLEYHKNSGSFPPQFYIDKQIEQLGFVRLGNLEYRARWIRFNSEPDTILAYAHYNYLFWAGDGCVVLRLDGSVEWMDKNNFEKVLTEQQTQYEIDFLLKKPKL